MATQVLFPLITADIVKNKISSKEYIRLPFHILLGSFSARKCCLKKSLLNVGLAVVIFFFLADILPMSKKCTAIKSFTKIYKRIPLFHFGRHFGRLSWHSEHHFVAKKDF